MSRRSAEPDQRIGNEHTRDRARSASGGWTAPARGLAARCNIGHERSIDVPLDRAHQSGSASARRARRSDCAAQHRPIENRGQYCGTVAYPAPQVLNMATASGKLSARISISVRRTLVSKIRICQGMLGQYCCPSCRHGTRLVHFRAQGIRGPGLAAHGCNGTAQAARRPERQFALGPRRWRAGGAARGEDRHER